MTTIIRTHDRDVVPVLTKLLDDKTLHLTDVNALAYTEISEDFSIDHSFAESEASTRAKIKQRERDPMEPWDEIIA